MVSYDIEDGIIMVSNIVMMIVNGIINNIVLMV